MHGIRARKRSVMRRRITPRQARNRRILAAVLVAVLAVVFLTSFFIKPKRVDVWCEYAVEPGDTLWSICREVYGDGDIRREIDLISAENGITGGRIYPGSMIFIPER